MKYISECTFGNLGRPWPLAKAKKKTIRFISKKSAMKKVLNLMNPSSLSEEKEYLQAKAFNSWIWQWKVGLTFPDYPRFDEQRVKKLLKDWTRKLCTEEGIQVGYFYSLVFKGKNDHPHLHLLMLGRSQPGKTLGNVDRTVWERKWPYWSKIEIPKNNYAVSHYLDKNLSERDSLSKRDSELGMYNGKLLKKVRCLNKCHLTHTRIDLKN